MHHNPVYPNTVEKYQDRGNYLVYDHKTTNNILFIGSCRICPLMFYASEYLKLNVYGILVYKCIDTLNEQHVRDILKNTRFIVCENIVNYGILNTNTFQKHFATDIPMFVIPNLDHRMYLHDLKHTFKVEGDEATKMYHKSVEHLKAQCYDTGFPELWEFIDKHITSYRLFATYNHPTRILSLVLFKMLMRKIGYRVPIPFFHSMIHYKFLEGNDTPIFKTDIETYGFQFKVYPVDADMFNTEKLFVHCHPDPHFIPNSLFE